jgi:hypothetical protein
MKFSAANTLQRGDWILEPNGGRKYLCVMNTQLGREGDEDVVYVETHDKVGMVFTLLADDEVQVAP